MKRTKHLSVVGVVAAVALIATGRASAAFQAQSGSTPSKGVAAERAPVKKGPCVCFASDLIGMKVLSTKGEEIGKIEDVVIHPAGEVAYAVLSFGGFLGMGDKLFAIPWQVLESKNPDMSDKSGKTRLVLPLDKERLKNAPGFDKSAWPAMTGPDWAKDVDTYYKSDRRSGEGRPVEASGRMTSPVVWRASDIKGFDVKTPNGDNLGDIKEVALDLGGRVNYVAVSVGGFLGIGDRLVAVPWDALKVTQEGEKGDKKKISLAITKERLEQAPVFKKDVQAEMCDPAWVAKVYQFYSVRPYWSQSDPIGG